MRKICAASWRLCVRAATLMAALPTAYAAAFLAAVGFAALPAAAAEPELSEFSVTLTDLTPPAATGKTFAAATLIDAPVRTLCAIIVDYPAYPAFMPNTDRTEVRESTAVYSIVDISLKLPLGKMKHYRLRMEPESSPQLCHVAWHMVPRPGVAAEETITDTRGHWRLVPWARDRSKTEVHYEVYTDPGPVPLGFGWIVDALSKDSLPKTLEALRVRARVK